MRGRNSELNKRVSSCLEAIENSRKGTFKIKNRIGPSVDRGQHIRQHDLAIETGKMITEKWADYELFISLVSAAHHRP